MAFLPPFQSPHVTDPMKLVAFLEKSKTKAHPIQIGGGMKRFHHQPVPLEYERSSSTPAHTAQPVRLVSSVEAQLDRARQDIKNNSPHEHTTPAKGTKRSRSPASPATSKKKRRKRGGRDVFNV